MKRTAQFMFLCFTLVWSAGCVSLMVGAAVGAGAMYAVSKDTVQEETDKSYNSLWPAAITVAKMRGIVRSQDESSGVIEADIDKSQVSIHLIRLTRATTRIKISARKYSLPNFSLAQDLYTRIMEQAE